MIRIVCPECGKKFKVDDSNAGKKAKCAECGTRISIPITEAPLPSDLRSVNGDSDANEFGHATDLSSMLPTNDAAEQSSDDPWDDGVEEYPAPRTPRKRNPKPARPNKTRNSRSPLLYVGIGGGAVLIVLISVGATLLLSGAFAKTPELTAANATQQVEKAVEKNEPKVALHEKTVAELVAEASDVLDAGDNDAALIAFAKAINADNQSAAAFNGRGVAYLRSAKLKPALADFTRAIELKSDEAKFYANRAFVYQDQGIFGLAFADLKQAINLEPQSPQWYQQRAFVFALIDDMDHEKADLARAEALENAAKKEGRNVVANPQRQVPRDGAQRDIANANKTEAPSKPAAETRAMSKLSVEVTFEFNRTVGNKPDTGSHVILVPKNVKSIPVSVLFPRYGSELKALETAGACYAKVGGNGRAILNRVRPGTYKMYIISEKTHCEANLRDIQEKLQQLVFPGMSKVMAFQKMHFEEIEVGEGENLDFSHDFGLTAF